MTFYNTCD